MTQTNGKIYGPDDFFIPSEQTALPLALAWNQNLRNELAELKSAPVESDPELDLEEELSPKLLEAARQLEANYKGSIDWDIATDEERADLIRSTQAYIQDQLYGFLIHTGENPIRRYEDISERLIQVLKRALSIGGTDEQWKKVVEELCQWIESQGGQVQTGWGFATYKDGKLMAWREEVDEPPALPPLTFHIKIHKPNRGPK